MHAFQYHRPASTKDALALSKQKDEGKYLAGGQSLVQAMKLRLSSPSDHVFAFYPNKQITTGEGGMVTTHSEKEWRLLRSLRNQGRADSGGWLEHARLGFNYRL